ncbi:TonB family protein [Sphingomonas bacterium]|uniref:TonB family protein n=1 Tax=Sphingomonas bacterium TaxID=1895847 RepID=UPI00262F8724|nr:TonB family protein [Sphingomonas bacterium]MDB5679049.1 energy transducer TonB [Sphingomonas bacterium]
MYANQFAADRSFKPGSMTLALAMTVLPIAGLIISTHAASIIRIIDGPIEVRNIPLPKDPPPIVKPRVKPDPQTPVNETTYVPRVDTRLTTDNTLTTTTDLGTIIPLLPEVGNGTAVTPPPIAKPVLVGASYDPRYANALQPPYPASEIRGGNSGRVVIRVLIGADGRVKQVERIAAASDAFFAAAQNQALTKWRFKPATSDGTPIEQWKTMSLRFVLQDDQ